MYLGKTKLDCIEMLISASMKDGIIDHNDFLAIIKEKKQYDNEKKIKAIRVKPKLFNFFLFFEFIIMFSITIDKWQDNGVEVVIFEDKKWLNEKHIETQLDHSNLTMRTTKYPKYLSKERQEIQNCDKYQPCRKFLSEDFAVQTIMDCRTTAGVNYRTRLGFKQ